MNIKPIWIVIGGIVTIVMFLPYLLIAGQNFEDGTNSLVVVGYILMILVGTFGLLEWNHRTS